MSGSGHGPLFGLHAVVTGAGKGIGYEIAKELAARGATISLLGRDQATLDAAALELRRLYKREFSTLSVDIGEPEKVRETFEILKVKIGAVQILINNAGIAESAPFVKTNFKLWERMIRVNLHGAFLCTSEVLPDMLSAKNGRIINIASTAGIQGYAYVSAYCAAKHGVLGLTRSLALETKDTGVTVNAVCPGFTNTDLFTSSLQRAAEKTGRSLEEVKKEFLDKSQQKRLIEPIEVARKVVWFCEPAQSKLSGEISVISGNEPPA